MLEKAINWFVKSFNPSRKQVLISISREGFSYGVCSPERKNHKMEGMQFVNSHGKEEVDFLALEKSLTNFVKSKSLEKGKCNLVLGSGFYDLLLQTLPPQVVKSELHRVLKFQVKDLVDFPLEEIIVDEMEIPQNEKFYAVVADARMLRRLAKVVERSGLSLLSVSIQESVMCDLNNVNNEEDIFVIQLVIDGDGYCVLSLLKGENLYFVRNFFVDLEPEYVNLLANEIKRSIKMIDGEILEGKEISKVDLISAIAFSNVQILKVGQELGIPVEIFDFIEKGTFKKVLQVSSGVDTKKHWLTLGMAYGLAVEKMRRENEQS